MSVSRDSMQKLVAAMPQVEEVAISSRAEANLVESIDTLLTGLPNLTWLVSPMN